MEKEKIVNLIINSDGNSFTEDDRATLMSMPEAVLNKMTDDEDIDEEDLDEEEKAKAKAKVDKKKKVPATNADDGDDEDTDVPPLSVNEYLANNKDMPEELKESLMAGQVALNSQKNRYIKIITANKKNPFKAEQLKIKSLEELRGLAQLAAVEQPKASEDVFDYSGQGDLQDNAEVNNEEPLDLPVMNFATAGGETK